MDYGAYVIVAGRSMSKPCKRWRVAFAVIFSCRAMRSFTVKLLRNPSYVSLSIQESSSYHELTPSNSNFSVDDSTALANLVKAKNSDDLSHFGGATGLTKVLATNAETGISGDSGDLRHRREVFGSNTYIKPKSKSFFRFVFEAINDFFLLLLVVCAVLSLIFGIKEHGLKNGWYDGASIFVAVFLVTGVSAMSNYRQDRRFQKLSEECGGLKAGVLRDGRRIEVLASEIVVGDVVWLKTGDQVPADGVYLDGYSLLLDESSMTGESEHITVDATKNPFLTSGVKVADGYGRMLVTAVGMNTSWGEMMSSISRDVSEQTPLQERLQRLTSTIGKLGTAVAVAVLAVLLIRYFTVNRRRRTNDDQQSIASAIVSIVSDAVTIIVVAVPEGLPLAVTLTLAYSMKRMIKDNALVRRLSACETMGAATVVCTDKTGTLTLNEMTVTEVFSVDGGGPAVLELLRRAVGMNTSGEIYKSNGKFEFSGGPTEKALLSWGVKDLNLDMDVLKLDFTVLHVETFNSEKKRSGVVLRDNRIATKSVHWKGAAEMVLSSCSHFINGEGIVREINGEKRSLFESVIREMASESLRCIAFAYKDINSELTTSEDGDELTLLGFVGLKDPCRPEVKSAVKACMNAGVAVKMITGDNAITAKSIAIECGILKPSADDDDSDGIVIEGSEFRSLDEEERLEIVDRVRVMAWSTPFDKLLMVQCLKKKGHAVAVTGDGTNDAPALKEADVGLSMGNQGTEVAKESSDVVILDDNFNTVVTVILWGRGVFNNIQKFLQFQLTVNVAALTVNFISAVSNGDVPLTTVQLLWVNLIMDTLGALALATEKPDKNLLENEPIGRKAPLISIIMWRNLLVLAAFQITVLLVFQFAGESIFNVDQKVKNTMMFNTFVLCQIFNEFNSRDLEKKNVFRGILKNRMFLGIVVVTMILQALMVELLNRFAGTKRLSLVQWTICLAVAAASWPIGWIAKCIPVSSSSGFLKRFRLEKS